MMDDRDPFAIPFLIALMFGCLIVGLLNIRAMEAHHEQYTEGAHGSGHVDSHSLGSHPSGPGSAGEASGNAHRSLSP